MTDFNNILVPTDFSDNARLALDYACSLAGKYEASLHLLHVIPDPTSAMGIYEQIGDAIPPDWVDTMTQYSDEHLAELPGEDRKAQNSIIRITLQGDTFNVLTEYARDNDIDLIVIGIHGKTASLHQMVGGLADKISRKAPCPVLTVPSEDHQYQQI